MKMPLVTWIRPETARSNPGQGEALVNSVEACRGSVCKRSSDFGLGVKSQSRAVIAGSRRS